MALQVLTLVAAVAALLIALPLLRRVNNMSNTQTELSGRVQELTERVDPATVGQISEKVGLPNDWAPGGTLTIRLQERPLALNPLLVQDIFGRRVVELVCESLYRRDLNKPDLFRPCLATDYEQSADGLTYTFRIHPQARFADGEPVNADDVLFTFRMLRDERIVGAARAAYLADLAEVTERNQTTVVFRFERPYALAFEAVATRPILPKHVYDLGEPQRLLEPEYRDLLVGSGPFRVDTQAFSLTGDVIELRKSERYWDRVRAAALERIEFRVVREDSRAYQLMKTGGADMMYLSPEQYVDAQQDRNFRKYHRLFRYRAPNRGFVYIGWNNRRAPLEDSRVRRALTHLTPRQQILDEIYKGMGKLVEVPFWSEGSQYPPKLDMTAYDPEVAGRLLDEAGWRRPQPGAVRAREGKRLELTILAPWNERRDETMLEMLADSAAAAGVHIHIETLSWPDLQQRVARRDFDAVLLGWTAMEEVDPYLFWHSSQAEPTGLNIVGFRNDEADRLTEAIRRELDPKRRYELCHELGRLLAREQPYTMLLEPDALVALSTKFSGVERYRLGLRPQEWYIPRNLL